MCIRDRAGNSGSGLFGDVIQEIDWSMGRIMAALESAGVADNTLILFASDNGPWLSYGDHAGSALPLREGKGTTFDGGIRVPFLATWPGMIPEGLEVSTPAMTIDLFPTLAELLDAELPTHAIDGKDIWPLFTGESTTSPHEAYFFWYHNNQLEAMRSGKWKLHFPHRYRTMQGQALGNGGTPGKYTHIDITEITLYDLERDIGETTDVAADNPEVVERLVLLADAKRAELGDNLTNITGSQTREPGRIDAPASSQ